MNCKNRGPVNLDTSDIMPKQTEKEVPKVQKEETKQPPKNASDKKKDNEPLVPPIPASDIPKEQPAKLSTNRIGSKIDQNKLNKIQYSGTSVSKLKI